MLCSDFEKKLKEVDPKFYLEFNHRAGGYHPDFYYTGIYYDYRYVGPVPLGIVPDYSIVGVDKETIELNNLPTVPIGRFYDKNFIDFVRVERPKALKERFLARGLYPICSNLVNKNLIKNLDKFYKVFGFTPESGRNEFPKRYLSCEIKTVAEIPDDDIEKYFWVKGDTQRYFT